MLNMRKYVPIGELADRSVLTQRLDGSEPDLALALSMHTDKMLTFAETGVLWDVVLPSGADDNNRIHLNARRIRHIRRIGSYSLINFVDTSNTDRLSSGYLGDGGVENGVVIGINIDHFAEWTRGRYRSVIPMISNSRPSLGEDAFWADELEGAISAALINASEKLSPLRTKAITALARAHGLIKLLPSSNEE
jgi:hypothetical protein